MSRCRRFGAKLTCSPLRWEQNLAELRCFFSVFSCNFIIIFVAVIYCIGGAVVQCVAKFLLLRKLCDVLRTVQGS